MVTYPRALCSGLCVAVQLGLCRCFTVRLLNTTRELSAVFWLSSVTPCLPYVRPAYHCVSCLAVSADGAASSKQRAASGDGRTAAAESSFSSTGADTTVDSHKDFLRCVYQPASPDGYVVL